MAGTKSKKKERRARLLGLDAPKQSDVNVSVPTLKIAELPPVVLGAMNRAYEIRRAPAGRPARRWPGHVQAGG